MNRHKEVISILFAIVLSITFFASLSFASSPNGANITNIPPVPQRTPTNYTPSSDLAFAGNVTEIMLSGFTPTQSWQGYFGNVTGVIQLTDAESHVMYNWSLASPQGEVYASTNSSGIIWNWIQCFNFTALGTLADDKPQAGATSLYGTNMTLIETMYNITWDDVDGVNETFTLLGSGHDQFYTANRQFEYGECLNTRIFDNSGGGVDNHFEEVLLYEPESTSIIFATILEEDVGGFDTATHDFEMLVLENGHGTDVSPTTYYFYVEIE